MYQLTGQDMLRIWEAALSPGLSAVGRALIILAIALQSEQSISDEALARLSIGKRDALLFIIRERTFGPLMNCVLDCPACQEHVEFSFSAADLGVTSDVLAIDADRPEEVRQFCQDGYEVQYRLPNSVDLASLAGNDDETAARQRLVQRCVVHARKGGEAITADALPDPIIIALEQHIAECDPYAVLEIDLRCPSCAHHWQTTFDIVSFFWTEISAQARRLLREVHTLALAYGWREADILSMSAARRLTYLEMVI